MPRKSKEEFDPSMIEEASEIGGGVIVGKCYDTWLIWAPEGVDIWGHLWIKELEQGTIYYTGIGTEVRRHIRGVTDVDSVPPIGYFSEKFG